MYWSNRRSAALAAALTLYSGSAEAFWRLPCRGQAGVARMDPLVQPGGPSDHAHVIHGASSKYFHKDIMTSRMNEKHSDIADQL